MKRSVHLFIFALIVCTQVLFSQDEEGVYLSRIEQGIKHYREQAVNSDSEMAIVLKPYSLLTDEKIEGFKPLFLDIYQKEKELSNDFYQIITAQNAQFLCYQIILKELMGAIENKIFHGFEFFRDPMLRKYQNLEEFLSVHPNILCYETLKDKNSNTNINEILAEDLPEISDRMISASLTMESCPLVESAQYVFITGAGMGGMKEGKEYLHSIIAEIFLRRGIAPSIYQPYVEQWLEMMPKSSEGIIYQIFIAKQFASDMLYVSLPVGLWLPESKDLNAFFQLFKESQHNGDIDIFQSTQVRVLIDAITPSNSLVLRYSTIDQKEIEEYTLSIRQGIQEIFEQIYSPVNTNSRCFMMNNEGKVSKIIGSVNYSCLKAEACS